MQQVRVVKREEREEEPDAQAPTSEELIAQSIAANVAVLEAQAAEEAAGRARPYAHLNDADLVAQLKSAARAFDVRYSIDLNAERMHRLETRRNRSLIRH